MPGNLGYSDMLNISHLFRQRMAIEYLDLSRNMLGVIYPSIISFPPNLIHLDISFHNLQSQYNICFFNMKQYCIQHWNS